MKNSGQCTRAACGLRRHLTLRIERLTAQTLELGQRLDEVTQEREALHAEVDRLRVTVKELQTELYGRSSERTPPVAATPSTDGETASEPPTEAAAPRRPRGQQPGAPGHGRHPHPQLPEVVVEHELPPAARQCPRCHRTYRDLGDAHPTEELDWELRIIRRRHRQHRYVPTCQCPDQPAVLVAPAPPRPIRKGLFSARFLAQLAIEKFVLGLPVHRIRHRLAMAGLPVSAGTLTGVLQRLQQLLQPWYQDCQTAQQAERYLQADETGWPWYDDRGRHRGWLWVFIGSQTTVFEMAATRGGRIVRQHFRLTDAPGTPGLGAAPRYLVSDFYAAYQQLERHGWVLVGCWAHARRPIVRVGRAHPALAPWSETWRARVAELYRRYRVWRAAAPGTPADHAAHAALVDQLEVMRQIWTHELVDPTLRGVAQNALRLMARNWERLTQFLADRRLPLDNNASERALRTPVIGRKNFLGSRAWWAGQLAAQVWTFVETARQHHVDPLTALTRYLEACAAAEGAPPPAEARQAFHFWGPSAPPQEDSS